MRHGHRGAAEIAQALDNLYAFAALTDANPAAARGMADKFDQAIRRGFWTSRRNSTAEILAGLRA